MTPPASVQSFLFLIADKLAMTCLPLSASHLHHGEWHISLPPPTNYILALTRAPVHNQIQAILEPRFDLRQNVLKTLRDSHLTEPEILKN